MRHRSDQSLRHLKVFYTVLLSLFSHSLWVLAFCCGLWCSSKTQRESSLSFWTDSLSLSLSYWIYLPLFGQVLVSVFLPLLNLFAPVFFFFFHFIRRCVTIMLVKCWWVSFFFFFKCIDSILICEFMLLSCESYLLSGVDGVVWCGVRVGIFELGK